MRRKAILLVILNFIPRGSLTLLDLVMINAFHLAALAGGSLPMQKHCQSQIKWCLRPLLKQEVPVVLWGGEWNIHEIDQIGLLRKWAENERYLFLFYVTQSLPLPHWLKEEHLTLVCINIFSQWLDEKKVWPWIRAFERPALWWTNDGKARKEG